MCVWRCDGGVYGWSGQSWHGELNSERPSRCLRTLRPMRRYMICPSLRSEPPMWGRLGSRNRQLWKMCGVKILCPTLPATPRMLRTPPSTTFLNQLRWRFFPLQELGSYTWFLELWVTKFWRAKSCYSSVLVDVFQSIQEWFCCFCVLCLLYLYVFLTSIDWTNSLGFLTSWPHHVMNPQYCVVEVMQPSAPLPEISGVQQLNPTNGSQLPQERRHSAPYGTSNDVILPRNQACVFLMFTALF